MRVHVAGTGTFAAEIAGWARASGATVHGLIEMRDPARVGGEAHGLPIVASDGVSSAGAIIGAGAVVLRDAPPGARVQGLSARQVEVS